MFNKRLLLFCIVAMGMAHADELQPILERSETLVKRYMEYYAEDKGSKEFNIMLQKRSLEFKVKEFNELIMPERIYIASLRRQPNCPLEALVVYDLAKLSSCKSRLKQALFSTQNEDAAKKIKNQIAEIKQVKNLITARYVGELDYKGKECI